MNKTTCLSISILLLAIGVARPCDAAGDGEQRVLDNKGKLNLDPVPEAAISKSEVVPAPEPTATSMAPLLRSLGGLLIIAGLLGGSTLLFRRYNRHRNENRAATAGLEIVERMSLGPRREVLLVRVCDQLMVLANLPQDLKFLTTVSCAAKTPKSEDAVFGDLLTEPDDPAESLTPTIERIQAHLRTAPRPEEPKLSRSGAPSVDWPGL